MDEDLREKIENLNVLVIGDVMLDKYFFTDVERISPEAPIPVARFLNETLVLGGAANVALNVSKLGAKTYLLGMVGDDDDGKYLGGLLEKNKINFIPIMSSLKTISKVRILSKQHQLLRLDFEDKVFDDFDLSGKIIEKISENLSNIDLIIVSDYQKGLINSKLISYFETLDKYISIDTKPGTFTTFTDFSLIKPNFKEAIGIARNFGSNFEYENTDSSVESLGKFLKEKLRTPLLITRSEMGASYIGDEIIHSRIELSDVSDVTGAGDTCIAIFSMLDYLKIEKEKALEIMNVAAKITVSHLGTYAPSFEEIEMEIAKEDFENIVDRETLSSLVLKLKEEGKKIVFTNGCFDLLHKAHVDYLNKAKELGDVLIVGINSDLSVKRLKGNERPFIDEMSRAFVLSNLKAVDFVIVFDEDNPIETIKIVKPNIHVKGGDYKKENLIETPIVEKFGGKVEIVVTDKDESTTKIAQRIKNK